MISFGPRASKTMLNCLASVVAFINALGNWANITFILAAGVEIAVDIKQNDSEPYFPFGWELPIGPAYQAAGASFVAEAN
jgi:hypothetical protein